MAASTLSTSSSFEIARNDKPFNAICEDAIKEFLEDPKTPKPADNPFVRYVNDRKERLATGKTKNREDPIEQTEECIRQFETQWTGSKGYNLRERVDPFIKGITSLIKSCESLLQPAPFGAAIAVSGFRIVLELSFKAHEAVDEVLKALEEVQPLLECYRITAASQHSSPEMSRAIQKSFKNILELWAHSAKILSQRYSRATVYLIIKPLKEAIQDFRDRAREDAQRVDRLLSALISYEKLMEKQQQAKYLLRKWIIGGEQDDLLGARNELKLRDQDRADGTCKWIFERQEFKDWRDAKGNSVLWYNALPGSGKSVLASAVINHLREQPESEVVYFFYTFKSASTRQETCGLRSIALQLLSKLDEASRLSRLTAQYDTAINEGRLELSNNDSDEVVKLLATLLTHERFAQLYVVLDGLDECSIKRYGDHSFPGLRQLLNLEALGAVKWYLSSRDIPEIRSLKEASKAVELEPNLADTSKDIWTFLDSQMICPKHDEPLFDIDEHIFLYAAIICKIAKDKTFGTKEAMFDFLQSFAEDFKDLTACYLKSLARIKGLGEQKRDLAIRTFRLLALSEKQLTLMELVDALNLYINPKNESVKSKEDAFHAYDRIKYVCSPFIKLEDSDGSQKVSLFHKSVRDFFFELGNREKIEEYLPGFFMEELDAAEKLGVNCIEYLNDQRYQNPENLKALVIENLSSYDNAFLRYAAVFWHNHLRKIEPKSETLKYVTEFLKSPGFWTCIYVQSHTAPYLFARYKRTSDNHYQPMMGTTSGSPFDFGLPLPPWTKENSSTDYASLDRSFCDFVQDWGELLAKNPNRLHHARPLSLYEPTCYLNPPNRLQNPRIKYVSNLIKPKSWIHIMETCFPTSGRKRGQTLRLRVIREDGVFPDRQIKVDTLDLFSRPKSDRSRDEIIESPAPGGQWITTIARDINKGKFFLQSWAVNNYDLSITRRRLGNSSGDLIHRPPHHMYNDINLEPNDKGIWNLVQLDVVTQPTRKDGDPVTRLFYYRKYHSSIQLRESAGSFSNAINRDSGSYTSPDSDEHSDWDSESGDDSDSSDAPGVNEEKHGNLEEPKARDAGSKDPMTECFIVASDLGKPVWRLVPAHDQLWSRVIGTRHPTRPIVAISHNFGLVDIMNDEDGLSSSLELPESRQDEAAKAVASSREVQFSPCGNFLTLLSVFFYPKDAYVECKVTASCFEFTQSPSGDRFQAPKLPEFTPFIYIFSGSIGDLSRPYIMTTWTAECVILTLPPLNYSPKVIKISLWPRKGGAVTSEDVPMVISTLTNPIFFPQSTVSRNPHIMYCDGSSHDEDSYLYLILDNPDASSSCPESTLRCGPGHFRGSENDQATCNDKRAKACGPVVMGWKIVGTRKASSADAHKSAESDTQEIHAWREWRDEDQSSEDVKAKRSASDEFRILRGEFVGETYSVPIRSGLDWTREGFLTC